jgi:hypothetical protein
MKKIRLLSANVPARVADVARGHGDFSNDVAAAYHEAGHAVLAVHVGGTLDDAGVTIDGFWHCGGRFQFRRDAVAEHIVLPYILAGDCAEFEFLAETEPFASRRQVADALRAGRSGAWHGDLEYAMAILRKNNPYLTSDALFDRYKVYAEATYAVLQETQIARAVNMVAAALLRKGRLSAEEVNRIYLRATTRRFRRKPLGKAEAPSSGVR